MENGIYHDVKHPAHKNIQANISWRLDFKILPTGVSRADGDDLEDTQEASSDNGHPPEDS